MSASGYLALMRSRASLRRRHTALALLALPLVVAACGSNGHAGGTSGSPRSTTATRTSAAQPAPAALTVGLKTPDTPPKAGSLWPITVTARTASGAPVDGTVSYAFLLGGQVVARRPAVPGKLRAGVYHDELEFPAEAVGYPLTLEVIVTARGRTGSVRRSVQVQR
jgi:hypothetical protein